MNRCAVVVILGFLIGCGGSGGGDGGGDSDIARCSGYCSFSCDKAAICFQGVNSVQCASQCITGFRNDGSADGDKCAQAQQQVYQMNCAQLASALGLARTTGEVHPEGWVERLVTGK